MSSINVVKSLSLGVVCYIALGTGTPPNYVWLFLFKSSPHFRLWDLPFSAGSPAWGSLSKNPAPWKTLWIIPFQHPGTCRSPLCLRPLGRYQSVPERALPWGWVVAGRAPADFTDPGRMCADLVPLLAGSHEVHARLASLTLDLTYGVPLTSASSRHRFSQKVIIFLPWLPPPAPSAPSLR